MQAAEPLIADGAFVPGMHRKKTPLFPPAASPTTINLVGLGVVILTCGRFDQLGWLSTAIGIGVYLAHALAPRRAKNRGISDPTAGRMSIRYSGSGHVALPDGNRHIVVAVTDILAVEACGNYVEIVRSDSSRLVLRSSLKKLLSVLGNEGVVHCHRRWLVTVRFVSALRPTGNGDWQAEIGQISVPVSRRFKRAVEGIRNSIAARDCRGKAGG